MKKFVYALVILLSFFCALQEAEAYSYYLGEPTGNLAETQPYIYQQLIVGSTLNPTRYEMKLNDQVVPVQYDAEKERFYYQPDSPLPSGTYQVDLSYEFPGYRVNVQKWSFEVLKNPLNPFSSKNKEELDQYQQEVIAMANVYREQLGLSSFKRNEHLQKAAQAHANYSQQNNDLGHVQSVLTSPLFFGQNVDNRTTYFGYPSWRVGEGISFVDLHPKYSVQSLIDAPYHRFALISPFYHEVGFGYVDGRKSRDLSFHVLNYGGPLQLPKGKIVKYPYPNQENVQPTWYVAEDPDPLRFFSFPDGEKRQIGYPITLNFFLNDVQSIEVNQASLQDERGRPVAHYLLTPEQDEHLLTETILIPNTPLQFEKKYDVSFSGNQVITNGQKMPFQHQWSFTTAPYELLNVEIIPSNTQTFMIRPITSVGLYAHGESFSFYNSSGQRIRNTFSYNAKENVELELEGTFSHSNGVKGSFNEKLILKKGTDGVWRVDIQSQLGERTFLDVPYVHPYYSAIEKLASLGVFIGNQQGDFDPNKNMTRAEFAASMVRMADVLQLTPTKSMKEFKDVNQGVWHYPYVSKVSQLGWIEGYDDQTFRPQTSFDRVMLAVVLIRMAGLEDQAKAYQGDLTAHLKDAGQIPKWARGYVYYALELRLMDLQDQRFDPLNLVSRAYAADAYDRLLRSLDQER